MELLCWPELQENVMTVITQSYTDGPDNVSANTDDNYFLELLGGDDRVVHRGIGGSEFNLGDGRDVVYLWGSNGLARGGLGNDYAHIRGLSNRFEGGDGADYINLRGGNYHRAWGGDGTDRFYITETTFGVKLWGDAGHDRFYGNDLLSSGQLYGGDGNDSFFGFASQLDHNGLLRRWTIYGGRGDDLYQTSLAGSAIFNERAGEGTDTIEVARGQSWTLSANFENLRVGTFANTVLTDAILTGNAVANRITGGIGAETLQGLAGNDILSGNGGNDTIEGADGDDTLTGGAGVDTMVGGEGNDIYVVNNTDGDVIVEAPIPDFTNYDEVWVYGGSYTMPSADVEILRVKSAVAGAVYTGNGGYTNTMYGSSAAEVFHGNAQFNSLNGGGGDDEIFGSDTGWSNSLNGGAGNDTIHAGLIGAQLVGGVGNDTLIGSAVTDSFYGSTTEDGVDYMEGAAGDDEYTFVHSDDIIVDTAGRDLINYWDTDGYTIPLGIEEFRVWMSSDGAVFTGNDEGNQIFIDDDVDTTIFGMGGDDYIGGAIGAETVIFGGDGNDQLHGGGPVELHGDAGDDWIQLVRDGDEGWGGEGDDDFSSLYAACTLHGDHGADEAITSSGDLIIYASHEDSNAVFGVDTLNLYEAGVIIDLSAIDANLDVAGQQHLVYVGNDTTPAIGELYDLHDSGGNIIGYAANLDGDADIEFSLTLISWDIYAGQVIAAQWDHDLLL